MGKKTMAQFNFELIKFQIASVSYDNFQKIAKNIEGFLLFIYLFIYL
jgi:hypothetical protein